MCFFFFFFEGQICDTHRNTEIPSGRGLGPVGSHSSGAVPEPAPGSRSRAPAAAMGPAPGAAAVLGIASAHSEQGASCRAIPIAPGQRGEQQGREQHLGHTWALGVSSQLCLQGASRPWEAAQCLAPHTQPCPACPLCAHLHTVQWCSR